VQRKCELLERKNIHIIFNFKYKNLNLKEKRKQLILAITGHRPKRLKGQEKTIKKWARAQLIDLNPSAIYCGMAQGTDQIIATAAKELSIPIICCYPFPKNYYHPIEEWIMENNEIIFINSAYSKKAYYLRDKFMIDHANAVLCVWDGICSGGTYITRDYAYKNNKKIIDYYGLREVKK